MTRLDRVAWQLALRVASWSRSLSDRLSIEGVFSKACTSSSRPETASTISFVALRTAEASADLSVWAVSIPASRSEGAVATMDPPAGQQETVDGGLKGSNMGLADCTVLSERQVFLARRCRGIQLGFD